jgi:hypothetical protein
LQPLESIFYRAKIVLKLLSVPVRLILFLTILSFIPGIVEAESSKTIGNSYLLITINSFPGIGLRQNDSLPELTSPAPATDAGRKAANDPAAGPDDNSRAARDTASTKPGTKKGMLEDEVTYTSDDSMFIDLAEKKLYLYGNAQVKYQNIELLADYIILDMGNEEVFAKGIPDSTGKVTKLPKFTQGSQTFDSDSLRYNFNTKNGIIYHIRTKEGEGFLHSETTKRFANEHIHLQNGKYTTCDADHPHFYLALTKGIVVPKDKIITGYAYMVIADIPIKLVGIPFGFFPNTEERTSGILMPTYGEEATRGLYLRDFGWYQVLGDYADLTIRGDIYSRGSWAIRNAIGYKWRYHFNGNFGFNYAVNTDSYETDPRTTIDYAVRWRHNQDAKANPTQNFSANVNFTSSRFDQNHSYSSSEYLNSTTSSSISFSKRWPSTPFNLSLSANATQNRQTETVDVSLPSGSFNMSSIYPFRSKAGSGKYKWYENVSLTYSSSFRNELSTYQDVLFEPETWDSLKNGFQHSIPLAVNFKIGKLINITPSMSYTGVLFSHHKEIADDPYYDTLTGDFIYDVTEFDNLKYEQAFNPNISISFNPKIYGMLVSSKDDSYVEAIRHVMTPSAGFSYTPDMQGINNTSYYDTVYYTNEEGERDVAKIYNWYEDELYNTPSSNGQNGSLRLSLNNNLEMKVRPRNDTTGESKKVVLLDNLNFSTSYNPFADSLRWSDLRLVTGTKLFNKKLDLRVNGAFTPYGVNETTGAKINEFYIQQEGGSLFRLTNLSVNTSFTLQSKQGQKKGEQSEQDENEDEGYTKGAVPYDGTELEDDMYNTGIYEPESYVDFEIPWSVSVRHSWSYTRRGLADPTISNTLNLSGDVSFTSKWKIGGQMNYDIENKEMSYTSLSIYRDLHCWEMRFSVIPFGPRQSYSFTIQAKGSLLRDLKYEKKPNWYDNFL